MPFVLGFGQEQHSFSSSLKLWKFAHEWCVQRNKGLSENRFKMEISIKNIWLLCENRCPSCQIPMIFAIWRGCPRHLNADLNHGALTSSTGIYKSINKIEKKNTKIPVVKPPLNFPDLTGWGVWRATYPDAQFVRSEARYMSSQRLRGWRGVTHPARFQGSPRFCEAARGI